MGRLNVHWRWATSGSTDSRCAAVSSALRVVHDGHQPRGIFKFVQTEIGEIIVADVVKTRVKELAGPDRTALEALIKGA